MFWTLRKPNLTIPIELHEKIARTCEPIDQVPSEVICIRCERKAFLEKEDSKGEYFHVVAHGA